MTLVLAAIFLDLMAGTFPTWENWYQDRGHLVGLDFLSVHWTTQLDRSMFNPRVQAETRTNPS
jgi:hypothetical protein